MCVSALKSRITITTLILTAKAYASSILIQLSGFLYVSLFVLYFYGEKSFVVSGFLLSRFACSPFWTHTHVKIQSFNDLVGNKVHGVFFSLSYSNGLINTANALILEPSNETSETKQFHTPWYAWRSTIPRKKRKRLNLCVCACVVYFRQKWLLSSH